MTLEEFSKSFLKEVTEGLPIFEINMNKLSPNDDLPFCMWANMFIHWMELGNKEDCERYYGHND